MNKNRFKKNIIFLSNEIEHYLFQLINIGKDKDQLKFNFNDPKSATAIIHTETKLTINDNTLINDYGEASYHSDGSFILKFPNYPIKSKQYFNPKSEGSRRRPLNEIIDWEPLFRYDIFDYKSCRKKKIIKETDKFIFEQDSIFNGNSFSCIINLVNKNINLPLHNNKFEISTRVNNVTETLDLWLVIAPLNKNGNYIKLEPGGKEIFSQNNYLEAIEKNA